LVGTLLAGGVTSCAFLAVTRVYQVCRGTGEAEFAREALLGIGLLSMAVAAVFVVRQRHFKRMLAYSSVEHMGILVIGVAVGGPAAYGAFLHMINNGLTKGVLFLSAGNIHRAYGSASTDHVSGALRKVPLSASLFLAGFFAITGSPPFGPFLSEFTIVRGTVLAGYFGVAAAFLLFLAIVFIGMGVTVLAVVQGEPPPGAPGTKYRDGFWTVAPVALFMAIVLLLGLYIPPPLDSLLRNASATLEGTP
jgi:hydrogenase-4 component F